MSQSRHAEPVQDELYREVVLDHHRRPRGRAPLARVDASARGLNPVCGDEVELRLTLDGDEVAGVQVSGRGCAICTASGSMLAELVPGQSVGEVLAVADGFRALMHGRDLPAAIDLGDLEALAGVSRFPVRVKCAMLPWVTLENALLPRAAAPETRVVSTEREKP
jgi:nitrogen fixation NifU-like protein